MGVGSVWLLFLTVRRWFGPAAGFIAGAALALTPVAVLMFRFNDPDAMMTFLMVVAAYFMTRALEEARTKWMVLTGLTMGFAFLAKGLQPFTLVPGARAGLFGLRADRAVPAHLADAARRRRAGRRLRLVARDRRADPGRRPSLHRRLDQQQRARARLRLQRPRPASPATRSPAPPVAVAVGRRRWRRRWRRGRVVQRLDRHRPAVQLADGWPDLVAAAGRAASASSRWSPSPDGPARTDRTRAAAILWGGWLLVTGAVLSFASGIIHTYYTVELAPAIAALVGIATVVLWRHRADINARLGARGRRAGHRHLELRAAAPHAELAPVGRARSC